MHRYKVSGDERSRDLNGDFRSLGSSGIFEALPGSRYGSSVDLTSETGARPRALPRALQPKTVKEPQQQRSFSYRHPVVALPPPRAPVTRGLASSSESAEGFRSQGYGNRGDRSLGNQNSGSHVLLASRPTSVQNQSAIARRNSASTFDHVTSATPGTAQADAQGQWIERRVVLKGGGVQSRGTAERENGTGRRNGDDDVGYRSVPLSNFRNRRNSSSDLDPMSKSSAPNAYVTCSKATISLAMPRSTRYGSLFDLSKDCGPTTEGGKGGGGGGRQTGSDVIGDGLFPRSSSGIGRNGTSGLSKDPDEEPVFGSSSSSSSFSSSNAREYRNPDASGSGGHVTGKTLNRRFENAVGRSPGTPVVVKRLENWNKTEKTTPPGDVTSDDRLTCGNGPPSSLAFRSRKFSFDQSTLPQKQNDFRSYPTSRGPAMVTSSSGPPKPPEAKAPPPPAPWARASAVPGLFGERSQSTTTLSRYPRGSSSAGGDLDSSTALLALRSSRYPSAQMTDGDGDLTMSASERVASSPWTARGAAPSESGEKNRGHHHHHHHLHQSPGQRVSSTDFPVESRSGSSASPDFQEVDDVINGRRYSSVVSCAPVTSEETGNRKDRFHSTAPPPAHDVINYSTAPSHVASSLYDVSGDDSSNYPASENSFAHRLKDNASLDLGDMATRKSSSPMPLPSFTWQIPRRNSLPVVALERKEDTTKTREGGRGRGGGGNYESIFSKGDWINAARMTWKSPSVTGSPVAERKPASFSTDGPGSFHDDWKTPSQSESSSAYNKMTSALPVEKSKALEKSKKAGENVVQNYSSNSKYLHESGGADPHSDSRISGERVASGIRESDRQWSDAIFREKSTTEEDSLAYGERGEGLSRSDSKTADWMESQQNTEPIEATRSHLERPNPAHDSQRTPEENCQSEISVPGSTKSSDSTGNDVNSTVLTSEQSDATLNLRDTSIVIHRVESDAGSRSPASREPARTRHLNFKEWYYGGLERTSTSTTDADQSYCATQVSDHESGYQSSGPTLDDLPPRKPNTADRKGVHREQIPSEDPEYSARIFQNGCASNAENKDSFISANGSSSSVVEKTFENGDDGKGKCHVPATDSSGSGRNPESGGPRELEVPVRASPLGVGFSIEGGRGSTSGDRPIIVKKIFTGGDHLSDKLKPGDAIVRVNDKDFTRLTHYEAWNYLKTLPEGPATFLVHTN